MNVFDFDNTIYDGECSLDFFKYCLKKKKSLIRYMPMVTAKAMKYKAGFMPIEEVYAFCEVMLGVFFDNCGDINEIVRSFWKSHEKKLKPFMVQKLTPDDVIISASPRFLFNGIAGRLNAGSIICTEIDEKNRKIGFLCYSQNKVKAFRESFGEDAVIDEFYTDNMNDMPLIRLAQKAFLVSGNDISPIA